MTVKGNSLGLQFNPVALVFVVPEMKVYALWVTMPLTHIKSVCSIFRPFHIS